MSAIEILLGPSRRKAARAIQQLLQSSIMTRKSAIISRRSFERVMEETAKVPGEPMPVVGLDFEQAVRLLKNLRNHGRVDGGKLSAESCRSTYNTIVRLHVAAGFPDPFGLKGEKGLKLVRGILKAWKTADKGTTGHRPQAGGVAAQPVTVTFGFLSDGPLTMVHLARMNARSDGIRTLKMLREQVRAMLVYETRADIRALRWVNIEDVTLGRHPTVAIPDRVDGGGSKVQRAISPELARLIRVLIDVLSPDGTGRGRPLVQGLKSRGMKWSGTRPEEAHNDSLRHTLKVAADQARHRGERVGTVEEVDRFVASITYESIRDGVLADCRVRGVPTVQLTVFLKMPGPAAVDRVFKLEDDRDGTFNEE